MDDKKNKVLGPEDYDMLIVGDAAVYSPEGELLAILRKNAIPRDLVVSAYPILTKIRMESRNRGLASGSERVNVRAQRVTTPVLSSVVGALEKSTARFPACRLTTWTANHPDEYQQLFPYFQACAEVFRRDVPDRYNVQMMEADKTNPAWLIPGTPYTSVTVNNSYATGVHQDAGDLKSGFSNLTVIRKGKYSGGEFVLPEFRVGFDIRSGDMLMMNPHAWHGNVRIKTPEVEDLTKPTKEFERISIVLYFRTKMVECGTPEEELERWKNAQKLL